MRLSVRELGIFDEAFDLDVFPLGLFRVRAMHVLWLYEFHVVDASEFAFR